MRNSFVFFYCSLSQTHRFVDVLFRKFRLSLVIYAEQVEVQKNNEQKNKKNRRKKTNWKGRK